MEDRPWCISAYVLIISPCASLTPLLTHFLHHLSYSSRDSSNQLRFTIFLPFVPVIPILHSRLLESSILHHSHVPSIHSSSNFLSCMEPHEGTMSFLFQIPIETLTHIFNHPMHDHHPQPLASFYVLAGTTSVTATLLQPNLLLLWITRTPYRSRLLRDRIHQLRHDHLYCLPLLCRRQHVLLLRRSPLGHGPGHGQRSQQLVNSGVRPRCRLRPWHPPQCRRHVAEKGGKLGTRRGPEPSEDHGFHAPHRWDRGGAGVRRRAEKATRIGCHSLTIISTWWCRPLPPRRGGEGVEARRGVGCEKMGALGLSLEPSPSMLMGGLIAPQANHSHGLCPF